MIEQKNARTTAPTAADFSERFPYPGYADGPASINATVAADNSHAARKRIRISHNAHPKDGSSHGNIREI